MAGTVQLYKKFLHEPEASLDELSKLTIPELEEKLAVLEDKRNSR